MGHLEYCTPECASALDVVRYDRAGDLLVQEAVRALKLEGQISFIRNNVDHYTGATFGCHENYSPNARRCSPKKKSLPRSPFLPFAVCTTAPARSGRFAPARSA